MHKIYEINKFASEIAAVDRRQVVKVASILDSLKSWYKSLFDSKYKNKVEMMKNDSAIIKTYINKLEKNINRLDKSISNGDVEAYNYALDQIQFASFALSEALKDYRISAEKSKIVEFKSEKENTELVVKFSDKVKLNFIVKLKESLKKAGASAEEINKIISDESIFKQFEIEVKRGIVSKSIQAEKSKQLPEQDREGEIWHTIQTEIFRLSNSNFAAQADVKVTDLSERKLNPKPILAVMNISDIKISKIEMAALDISIIKFAGQISAVKGLENKSQEFLQELNNVGNRLGINPSWLAAVMSAESGINPAAQNPFKMKGGHATGLIQLIPSSAKRLGTSVQELAKMSDVDQLHYVEMFYKPWAGRIKTPGDLYMATFLPIFVGSSPDTVIGQLNNQSKMKGGLTYHQVYEANAGLDSDKDGKIKVSDVTGRVESRLRSANKLPPINFESNSNSYQNTSLHKKELNQEEEEPGLIRDIFNKLMSFFGIKTSASNGYDTIIKKAVYEQILPINVVKTKINNDDFSSLATYAYILSEAIDRSLMADSIVYSDGKDIEIVSQMTGSMESISSAVIGVNNIISENFENKYNIKINYKISNASSEMKNLLDSEIEHQKRKFLLKNIKRA